MALAAWKDLCLDASDPDRLGTFWAGALGLRSEPRESGDVKLTAPDQPGRTIWVNRVPETRSVKHRVHPDFHDDLDRFLGLGATVGRVPDDDTPWHVLSDPEGGELCLFPREPEWPQGDGFFELVVDCADPQAQATWWAGVLGGEAGSPGDAPHRFVAGIEGAPFLFLVFAPVPEHKAAKNRWHWDVRCDDVDALVARGATLLRHRDDEVSWHVLADPEGNEFCVFATSSERVGA